MPTVRTRAGEAPRAIASRPRPEVSVAHRTRPPAAPERRNIPSGGAHWFEATPRTEDIANDAFAKWLAEESTGGSQMPDKGAEQTKVETLAVFTEKTDIVTLR